VVDRQLRAVVEQLRERPGVVTGVEGVLLLDENPGELPSLEGQVVATARVLFSRRNSSSRAACLPLRVPIR
jgi:hypothetical protein